MKNNTCVIFKLLATSIRSFQWTCRNGQMGNLGLTIVREDTLQETHWWTVVADRSN